MKPTTICTTCKRFISNNNIKKHLASCVGIKKKKVRGIDFDPNHGYKDGTRHGWNKGLTKDTDIRVKQNGQSVKCGYDREERNLSGAALFTKEERSAYAKKQKFGGYQPRAGRSKKFRVYDSYGNQVTLQSTFELNCSEILAELGINWIRPKALKYNGKNYFADFYLPDFDVWLDPKNDYKAKQDAAKIKAVTEQNNIRLYVLLEDQINKSTIASII